MSFTNNTETLVLNWLLTTVAVTRPATWFVALFTSPPDEAGSGTEVSGNGYARQPVTFTVSGGNASNSGIIEFPEATTNWGIISHVAIFDLVTSGTMLASGALVDPKTVNGGDILRFPVGEFDVNLD